MIEKLETWHVIEDDGSGDYYLVPVGLFTYPNGERMPLDEAYNDPNYYEKLQQCLYVGGFSNQVKIRGEVEKL